MRIWRYHQYPYVFMVAGPKEHRALATLHTYVNMLYPTMVLPYATWTVDFDNLHKILELRDGTHRASNALDQAYPNQAPCVTHAIVPFGHMNHSVFAISAPVLRHIYRSLLERPPENFDQPLVNLKQRYLTNTTPEEFRKVLTALTVLYTQAGLQHNYFSSPRTAELARAAQEHPAFVEIFVPMPSPQDIRQSTSLFVDSLGFSLHVSPSLLHKVLL